MKNDIKSAQNGIGGIRCGCNDLAEMPERDGADIQQANTMLLPINGDYWSQNIGIIGQRQRDRSDNARACGNITALQ